MVGDNAHSNNPQRLEHHSQRHALSLWRRAKLSRNAAQKSTCHLQRFPAAWSGRSKRHRGAAETRSNWLPRGQGQIACLVDSLCPRVFCLERLGWRAVDCGKKPDGLPVGFVSVGCPGYGVYWQGIAKVFVEGRKGDVVGFSVCDFARAGVLRSGVVLGR
jgi:hypothetical protein